MSETAHSIEAAGDRWIISGALTMDSAAAVLARSREMSLPPSGIVDLVQLDAVDSAGVAVLLAWQRRGAVEGKPLSFAHIPPTLTSLAALYDVEDVLQKATT